jgi:hypothetical protein
MLTAIIGYDDDELSVRRQRSISPVEPAPRRWPGFRCRHCDGCADPSPAPARSGRSTHHFGI